MRESPVAFEARTGSVYDPVPGQLALGAAVAHDVPVPTLFRFPGACGFATWMAALAPVGRPALRPPGFLAPPARAEVLVSERLVHEDALGAPHFGTVALLQPLRHAPVRAHGRPAHVWALANHAVGPAGLVWVPPAVVRGEVQVPWDLIAEPEAAWEAYGAGAADAWAETAAAVNAYLAELDALIASGHPGPGRPWCTVDESERRARLAAAGVAPRWTRSAAAARPGEISDLGIGRTRLRCPAGAAGLAAVESPCPSPSPSPRSSPARSRTRSPRRRVPTSMGTCSRS